MKKKKLKPVHFLKNTGPNYIKTINGRTEHRYLTFNTHCGIETIRIYGSWSICDVTCKLCLKTIKGRTALKKFVVGRLSNEK